MKTCKDCGLEQDLSQFRLVRNNYVNTCRTCYNLYMKTWSRNNKAKVNAWASRYHANNRDVANEKRRLNRLKNIESQMEHSRNWQKLNPEKARLSKKKSRSKRRALLNNNKIFYISNNDLRKIVNKPCFYCGKAAPSTIDHVIPVIRGGVHSIGNLIPACSKCNSSKGSKFIMEWKKLD